MSDFDDNDDENIVLDLIDDSIQSLPHAIALLARELLAFDTAQETSSSQHVLAFLQSLLEQNDRVDDRGHDERQPDRDEYCETAWA
jgi:hypothetical protein